jgi:hypothetical protein
MKLRQHHMHHFQFAFGAPSKSIGFYEWKCNGFSVLLAPLQEERTLLQINSNTLGINLLSLFQNQWLTSYSLKLIYIKKHNETQA